MRATAVFDFAEYTERWYCPVPRGSWQAVREEWTDDYKVRRIYEVKPVGP